MEKILILDTGKEWGGGTVSLLELLKRIDRNRYEFTALFYYNYDKPGEFDIKTEVEKLGINFIVLKNQKQPVSAKVLKETVRIVLFFNRKLRRLSVFWIDYYFKIKSNAQKIKNHLIDLNIDLLYMNNQPSSNLEGILAAKEAGIKSLIHSRFEVDLNYFEINAVNKWLSKTICVSNGLRDSFIKQGIDNSKCVVVYNGIDTSIKPKASPATIKKELGINENDLIIGSVGSLIKRKKFDDIISSLYSLSNKSDINNIKCLLIGEGTEKGFLLREINRKRLHGKVILTGFKSDVFSYINALDIFILASEREGFSRVVIEAMLMGKPVIASRIAGPSELVKENETGFLFKPGDVEAITDYTQKLISSPSLRKSMGDAGRKRVIDNFSIEKYVSRVGEVLLKIEKGRY